MAVLEIMRPPKYWLARTRGSAVPEILMLMGIRITAVMAYFLDWILVPTSNHWVSIKMIPLSFFSVIATLAQGATPDHDGGQPGPYRVCLRELAWGILEVATVSQQGDATPSIGQTSVGHIS